MSITNTSTVRAAGRSGVLLVVVLATLALPVLPAQGSPPDVASHEVPVRAWQRVAAMGVQGEPGDGAAAWVTSAPIAADDAVVVGAQLPGAEHDSEVEVRSHRDGRWTDWLALHFAVDEHGPDPWTDEGRRAATDVSDPVWVGRVDRLQVRVRSTDPSPDVTLHTVSLSGGDGLAWRPLELSGGAAAQAAPSQPTIVPRASWDPRGECTPRQSPSYAGDVRLAYVHHTASTNDYSASQGPAQVLSFCLYHRNSNGWDDIGYNALVDRYGNLYEGRAGGLTEPVIGAHAAGFNAGSTSIAMMGNQQTAAPTSASMDGLRRYLAWKLDLHHIDPHGTTRELSEGGGTNRYAEDQVVTLPTIVGHRATGLTACPGDHLHSHISDGSLADEVAALGAPKLYGGPRARDERSVIGIRPRWDVRLSSHGAWRLRIERGGTTVRTASGVGGEAHLAWDLRDQTGREVPPGTYTATFESPGTTAKPIVTRFDVTAALDVRAGGERIATSVALSRWAFNDPRLAERGFAQSEDVIIASDEAYPDALVATTLAGSLGAPILLAPEWGLTDDVVEEIRRLGADHAIVVGGTDRLTPQVEADLKSRAGVGSVERLAGPSRYETAGQVAWRVVEEEGAREVLLALGEGRGGTEAFQDALVAGAFGGGFELPVLLVKPDTITGATQWVLEQRSWSDGVTVVGGRGVITEATRSQARSAARLSSLGEIAGDDAYGTSSAVAQELLRRWDEAPDDPNPYTDGLEVVLATGRNWPDALAAGAAATERGSAFLLIDGMDPSGAAASRNWLADHADDVVHAVVAGGDRAVAPSVRSRVESLIRSAGPHRAPPESWGLTS